MSTLGLLFTLLFVLVTLLLSMWQKLDLEKEITIATIRSAVQLLAIGYVLEFVFRGNHPVWILLILFVMIGVAARSASLRGQTAGVPRLRTFALIMSTIAITETVTMGLLLSFTIIPFSPQYVIPISGMIIGNAMVVAGLYRVTFQREMETSRNEFEAWLALGATMKQALLPTVRRAVTLSLNPTIDSMKTVGLVQLPGMMTGMIVAGASPLEAVRYQILIMFSFSSSAAISAILLGLLTYRFSEI